ncbi:phosphoribosyltransferase [Candidatus Aciduliprofundum boonei]|uniref:Phosphoribosyltransferase n=1 Tax=Aciduliprofundum boonei (strain DSM 19572 / T469) TaxID=439481 RepID=D3T966_ACIB4|nr:phosphoribosyltransferase [Candidatus Aciduliprofundum boonei]ADD08645.1 phosphoribosyltransferase [Aciduliprofundum boonei T469]HII55343.1 phosphoribosyltransferase [Candidatus Aciduliprofundum boonei]
MVERFRCQLVSWKDIERWSKNIVKEVMKSGYEPEIVIGLARGGLVPARLIADYLNIKDLYAVKTEHWGLTATPDGKAKLAQGLQISIDGKRVLVVDDITDTGQSLKLAVDHIKGHNPSEIRSATLLHITHSKYVPDYYSDEVPEDKWTWFIFPWNVYEDMRNLIPKTLYGPKDRYEIKNALKEQFQIDVRIRIISEVLRDLAKRGIIKKNGNKWELVK